MVSDNAESSGLEAELSALLNSHSAENPSGTPDFILAAYLMGCLDVYNKTVAHRGEWRGETTKLSTSISLDDDAKEVPLVAYLEGKRNEIGTASVKVTPGEVLVEGRVIAGTVAIFQENVLGAVSIDSKNVVVDRPMGDEPRPTRFERYMRGEL